MNSKSKSKFLSKSGYIVQDVFAELRFKLLRQQNQESPTSAQIEQLCYWSAELVCSGRIKQLVSMLVDMYCTCFISKNLGFVERMAKSLDSVSTERFNPRSLDVQAAICALVIMLARHPPSRNPRSFATSFSYSHQRFIDGLQRPSEHASARVLKVLGPCFVECDILHILIHFWESLSEGDASKACCIIDHVTQKTKKLHDDLVGSAELLSITTGLPKAIQCDSVWVLWKLLMEVNTAQPTQKRLIEASLRIFKTEYSASSRKDRLNLLYACAIVLTTKKQIPDQPFEDKVIVQALEHLDQIYEAILGKPKTTKKPVRQKQPKQDPEAQQQHHVSNDEKMQALFCYAYVTPHRLDAITTDRGRALPQQPQQPQYKELDLQCGSWNPLGNDTVTVQKLDAKLTTQMTIAAKTSRGYPPLSSHDRLRSAT